MPEIERIDLIIDRAIEWAGRSVACARVLFD